MSISKVIIVHGSNSTEKGSKTGVPENERHWKPWLKKELEKRRINVDNPIYPKDWVPDYEEWKKVLEKNRVDENTILVGHSAGGGFLVRWLKEERKKIKKLILVSPGKVGRARNISRSNLYGQHKIEDIEKYTVNGIVIFTSNDDIKIHLQNAKEYEKELPAKVINLKNHGHFTKEDMGTEEFPELLEEILNTQNSTD